ncbi:MAG TPA: amidohydrolase family protein [Terriglobales bacterium]|nr:amidohydrolase family protein [Terriglobales bacterium]
MAPSLVSSSTSTEAAQQAPELRAPSGSCDCHIHIFGPAERYPIAPGVPYKPPLAPVDLYRPVMRRLNLERVVVVQPVAYADDNRCTLDAVAELGDAARAVVVVTPETGDPALIRWSQQGARGARFFMLRGSTMKWEWLERISARVADLGWHIQLQFDGREMPELETLIRRLPSDVVIDHNGKFLEPVKPSDPAMLSLLRLLDSGRCWVKASAPYETSKTGAPDYEDVGAIAKCLIAAAPERVVWATNWPHGAEVNKPDDAALLDTLLRWAPDEVVRHQLLVENPRRLYGFGTG